MHVPLVRVRVRPDAHALASTGLIGVNQVDALIQGGVNRADRLLFVTAPHIQPPMAQAPRPTREVWRFVPEMVMDSMNTFLH